MKLPHWLRCDWKPWVDTNDGIVSENDKVKGRLVEQERRCATCNKVELRNSIAVISGSWNR